MSGLLEARFARYEMALQAIAAVVPDYSSEARWMGDLAKLALNTPNLHVVEPVEVAPPEPVLPPASETVFAPKPRTSKPKPAPEPVGIDGLTETQQAVLKVVRAVGKAGAAPRDITGALGLTRHATRYALLELTRRGLVKGSGTTQARVYSAVSGKTAHGKATENGKAAAKAREDAAVSRVAAASRAPKPSRMERGGTAAGRVLEAVQYKPGTITEIAGRLELKEADVAVAMRVLERDREVTAKKLGDRLVWS